MRYWIEYAWDVVIDYVLYGGENRQLINEFYFGDLRRSR